MEVDMTRSKIQVRSKRKMGIALSVVLFSKLERVIKICLIIISNSFKNATTFQDSNFTHCTHLIRHCFVIPNFLFLDSKIALRRCST